MKSNDFFVSMISQQNEINQKINMVSENNQEEMQTLFESYMVFYKFNNTKMRYGVSGMMRKNFLRFCFENLEYAFLHFHYRYFLVGMDNKPINCMRSLFIIYKLIRNLTSSLTMQLLWSISRKRRMFINYFPRLISF